MIRAAHAILIVKGQYVLQLRDNDSNIPEPGMWSLFGGTIEKEESPEDAVVREIKEELSITLTNYQFFCDFEYRDKATNRLIHFHIFESDISDQWGKCRLFEGQSFDHFKFSELKTIAIPNIIQKILKFHISLDKEHGSWIS